MTFKNPNKRHANLGCPGGDVAEIVHHAGLKIQKKVGHIRAAICVPFS